MTPSVSVSVIVRAHERSAALDVTLTALARQDAGELEVLVAGGEDCAEVVASHAARAHGPVARVAASGAEPRNAAANQARGTILLFLDAEAVPDPGVISSHRAAQLAHPGLAVGTATHSADAAISPWHAQLPELLEDGSQVPFRWAAVLPHQLSVHADVWRALGGFDAALDSESRGWDLGLRAASAGARVCLARGARCVLPSTARAVGVHDALRHKHPAAPIELVTLWRSAAAEDPRYVPDELGIGHWRALRDALFDEDARRELGRLCAAARRAQAPRSELDYVLRDAVNRTLVLRDA
jgi:hypothetical protein